MDAILARRAGHDELLTACFRIHDGPWLPFFSSSRIHDEAAMPFFSPGQIHAMGTSGSSPG
jgi:hypothetical protein